MSSLQPEQPLPVPAGALFQILDSVLGPKSCAYVAGPLDSGREYYERMASGDHRLEVRGKNESRLHGLVLNLRERLEYPVFDSGLLKVSDWSGRDYGRFFLAVIRRYAKVCWLMNGWEYSIGQNRHEDPPCARSSPARRRSSRRSTRSGCRGGERGSARGPAPLSAPRGSSSA